MLARITTASRGYEEAPQYKEVKTIEDLKAISDRWKHGLVLSFHPARYPQMDKNRKVGLQITIYDDYIE